MAGALDVTGASPRRYFFEVLHHFAAAEHERERLEYLSSPEGRDDLYRYNQREGAPILSIESQILCYLRSTLTSGHIGTPGMGAC